MSSNAHPLRRPAPSCRVCGAPLFPRPLLRYEGMPKAAQRLPGEADLREERGGTVDVRQCQACGLVQLPGDPVPYYREVIRAVGFSEAMKAFRRTQFGCFVGQHRLEGKKLLEVGCGRGEYLSLLHELPVEAAGVEFSEESVAAARAAGLRVHRGFLAGSGELLPGAPYDAFFIFSFLEHLPDPVATLTAIGDNTVETAVGLVEVPNFDMILANDLFAEFIGDHLLYFTQETLIATLGRCGFETLACEAIWHGYVLTATVRKRQPLDLSRFAARRERLAAEIDAFIGGLPAERVAIWGAGHQAFAVMALAGLQGRVRYVVDSAPFKQGRYTPATHVSIVPPSVLDADDIEAVIVMAAGYSDEVVATLLACHPNRFRIAIVRENGLQIMAADATADGR